MRRFTMSYRHLILSTLLPMGLMAVTASANPTARFSPSKIQPNDSYDLYIDLPDGTLLDFELRLCELDLSSWQTITGPWQQAPVQGGKVTVPANQNHAPGIYMTRFKVRNAPASEYSNFDVLMVDDLPTMNPAVTYGAQTVNLPPLGSYMILESRDEQGDFLGYTRIDIETDPCEISGCYTMRFTKTGDDAYWNPTGPALLRWCVREDPLVSGPGSILISPGGTTYGGGENAQYGTWDPLSIVAEAINVTYPDNGYPHHTAIQGVLGGYPTDWISFDEYHKDVDLPEHYSILPPNRAIPNGLSPSSPTTIVELIFGHPFGPETGMDVWHSEAFAPTSPTDAIRMRYVEVGVRIEYGYNTRWWSVTEDWTWRADGLLSRITQWGDVDPLCWRTPYRCESSGHMTVDAQLIDWYIPDSNPLTMGFKHPVTGEIVDRMYLQHGGTYTMTARKHDGTPYSGFIEIHTPDTGETRLWLDAENKPIYFSHGEVTLDADGYGPWNDYRVTLTARPYLVNSSVNALYPVNDPQTLIPNASTAAYSNAITLSMSFVPPDFDADDDVDATDFQHFAGCTTGPDIPPTDPTCDDADLDRDDDVDQTDFGLFQACYSGIATAPDPNCFSY